MFKRKVNTIHTRDIVLVCVLLLVSLVPAEYMQVFQSIFGKSVLIIFTGIVLHYCRLISCILTVFIVIMVLHTTYEGINVENEPKDIEDIESTSSRSIEDIENKQDSDSDDKSDNELENELIN